MRTSAFLRRFTAGAAIVAGAGAGLLVGEVASAQQPDGTFTPSPASGSDVTIIEGTTNGSCNLPGNPGEPVDGYNAVVSGPGAFAPIPGAMPDGLQIVPTSDIGFSTTDPIHFILRSSFHDLAQELGTQLQPGDYVITFRCVNQFDGIIFQKFSATITFTGGPPATAYTVGNAPPASPSPSPSSSVTPSPPPSSTPTDSPSSTTDSPSSTSTTTTDSATTSPETSTSDAAGATTSSDSGGGTGFLASTGAPIALIFIGGLVILAAGLGLLVWLKRPKKAALGEGKDTSES